MNKICVTESMSQRKKQEKRKERRVDKAESKVQILPFSKE